MGMSERIYLGGATRLVMSPEVMTFGAGLGRREAQNNMVARLNDMGVQPRKL